MKKKFVFISILIFISLLVGSLSYLLFAKETVKYETAHLHASFQIYIDGELQDYSDFEYMHISPCNADTAQKADYSKVDNRIHLHDSIGDVAHIHTKYTTWRELFQSLKIENIISEDAKFILNNEQVQNLFDQEIKAYERVIFIFGKSPSTETLQQNSITIERIKEVEKNIESCGI